MEVYKNNNILVRTIEEKDKNNYLKLFDEEDFGCIGINEDIKPSLSETNRFLQLVIDKEIIDEEVLVLESLGEFIGYVTVSRPHRDQYHIGSIAVRKEKRNCGYGTLLLDIVKALALKDNCYVKLECINEAYRYFQNQGFENIGRFDYVYKEKNKKTRNSSVEENMINPIFVDYSILKEERKKRYEEESRKELESFQKILKSPLFDIIKNL